MCNHQSLSDDVHLSIIVRVMFQAPSSSSLRVKSCCMLIQEARSCGLFNRCHQEELMPDVVHQTTRPTLERHVWIPDLRSRVFEQSQQTFLFLYLKCPNFKPAGVCLVCSASARFSSIMHISCSTSYSGSWKTRPIYLGTFKFRLCLSHQVTSQF